MQPIIAWDFDGVLNLNMDGDDIVWTRSFEDDFGHSLERFIDRVFKHRFDLVLTGQEDVRERVDAWCKEVALAAGPDAVLDYWFEKDTHSNVPLVELVRTLQKHGIRQVIATNNDPRRTRYIETKLGFGAKVDRIFASGQIGITKPQPAFFTHTTESLSVRPDSMVLIDDSEKNVTQARALGWQAFKYTDITKDEIMVSLGSLTRSL